MSILKKPYEISVWQDVWQGNKFCEQRLGIIGTNEMLYQGRAIEPNLVRNVNGTKKFSFKMYKHFIDTTTGEKIDNPFIEWLISERKVKLKYEKDEDGKDIWYDFIIKDVVENSSNYLYTYQLEDALVQELSKNGFGVTLDEQLRNNMGNVKYLATETLKETDWEVESEVFVEQVDEALVYIQLPSSLPSDFQVYKLLDNEDDFLTVGLEPKLEEDTSIWANRTVLAFYSSCRNKPHRFQFIYLPNYDKANVSIDKNRQILNKNCQYYVEFESNKYKVTNTNYGFILPEGFSVVPKTYTDGSDIVNASDSTISTWYRGGRYGFAQKAEYIPLLDKYCQIYSGPEYSDSTSETGKSNTYYGYVDNKYEDLIFSTNLVENTEFSNTSGWTGTYNSEDASADKAVIENVYGKFIDNSFVSTMDVLADKVDIGQTFEEFLNNCAPYLKVELKSDKSLVINSGPYHNRTLIGNMPVGSKWALRAECYSNNSSPASLTFDIDEYIYNTTHGHYSASEDKKIEFDTTNQDDYTIYTVKTNTFTDEKEFTKNCNLKIAISLNADNADKAGAYYIKNLEFFRVRFDKDNKVIPLESQGTNVENLITTQYRYFKPLELDTTTEAKDIHYDYETETLSYETYKPVYNTNGEKIRAVSAKESNYFNILQSIAETFECWLDLQIIRNDPTQPGAITQKIAKFKNYAGGNNYACFRYGVNLKDIQRTYSSKNIVTKLMVKQNSNEHGENGMCTIARAGANPTGDTSIYDFSYFQNMGLMNAHDYIDTMYKIDGAEGPDVNEATSYNIQGYFPRIRAINDQLLDKVDEEIILKQRLLKLNSDLKVQKAKQSAAMSGTEEASESYFQMTGVRPTELVDGKVLIASVTLDAENKYNASNEEKKGYLSYYENDPNPGYTLSISTNDNEVKITANPSSGATFQKSKTLSITAYPILTTKNKSEFVQTLYFTLEIKKGEISATSQEQTPVINTESSQVKKYFNEYATYAAQKHEADTKVPELEHDITELQNTYSTLINTIQELKDHKIALNNLFFTRYSRFIQEGSWIDEKYYDDEKYYNDALSVMYNSCYPQVAYTINTFEVSQLPGYEMFNFNVGEKTWAEDGEFFGFNADGSPKKEEVIITEKSENLDDPSKNTNKVQNFKNQFQDLFQKITATVQQAQYSTGAYEKGVAEANAIAEDSVGFLREAMSAMTVNLDNPQVMSESTDKSSQLRIVDGKVLIGKRNQNTEEISWTTGLSSDGVAADLINTGRLNTSAIQIYGGDNPTFRWDARGISAYDYTNFNNVISGVNTNKFVRFDKHGIYGINDDNIDGSSWYPTGLGYDGDAFKEIDSKATFALTWEGLKVTGSTGGTARLGKQNGYIMLVHDSSGNGTFGITEDGKIETTGIKITSGTIGGQNLASTNYADGVASTAKSEAIAETQGLVSGLESTLGGNIEEIRDNLQDQIDGSITTYFSAWIPTHDNLPAKDWKVEDYGKHNGDLFYIVTPTRGEVIVQDTEPDITSNGDYWIDGNGDVWSSEQDGNSYYWEKLTDPAEIEVIKKVGYCYRWQYIEGSSEENFWTLITDTEVTKALADAAKAQSTADGRATIFGSKPSNYQFGDLLIPTEDLTEGGKTFDADKVYRCIAEGEHTSFNGGDWTEINYTDDSALDTFLKGDYKTYQDSIKTQLDGKAEIFFTSQDPAVYSGELAWGETEKGNLWHCTNPNGVETMVMVNTGTQDIAYNQESVWDLVEYNGGTGYGWKQIEIPHNIFDAYDGKCSLYVSKPSTYKQNDLWILDSTTHGQDYCPTYKDGSNNDVKYAVGTILVASVSANTYSRSDWTEKVKYTDNTELDAFKTTWGQDKVTLEQLIGGCIKTSDLTVTSSTDEKTKVTTSTITFNGVTTTSMTSPNGKYLLTNVGVGTKTADGSNKYFEVATDGALIAQNAVIYGNIFANGGYIAGWDITRTATEKSIKTGNLGDEGSFLMYAVGGVDNRDGTEQKPYLFGSTGSQTWRMAIGTNFGVTSDGKLYCTSGRFTGEISGSTITGGTIRNDSSGSVFELSENNSKIAGWNITKDALTNYGGTKDANGYYPNSFCMQIKTETNGAVNALAIGKCSEATWSNAAFRVTTAGEMYASNGRIGSCEFTNPMPFIIGNDMEVLYPGYRATNHITSIETSYLRYTYQLTLKVKRTPGGAYASNTFEYAIYEQTDNLYKLGSLNDDYLASYDIGQSASSKMRPETWTPMYNLPNKELTQLETLPHIWIKVTVERVPQGAASQDYGKLYFYIGDFSAFTRIFKLGNGVSISENIFTDGVNSIIFNRNSGGNLSGTWKYNDSPIETSWRGAKSNIEELDDRYSVLFDMLQPVRFTYNHGQSNRYHTGLILDELKTAMDEANVDTSELAAYCISDEMTGEGGIRYSELIALCIDQIQKLKPRASTLEQTILDYETRISTLETEIQNLKSS